MICCNCYFYTMSRQYASCFKSHILHFNLISAGKIRSYDCRKAFSCNLFGDQMSLTAMIQCHPKVEFIGNADCGENIIYSVYMRF